MTAAEMLELAERLEKEADSYYLQQGNNTVDDLRAAARVVRGMAKLEAVNERSNRACLCVNGVNWYFVRDGVESKFIRHNALDACEAIEAAQ